MRSDHVPWLAALISIVSIGGLAALQLWDPEISLAFVPGGGGTLVAGGIVLVFAWLVVTKILARRAWWENGRDAGLSARGGGPLSTPSLTGVIDGRSVRARKRNSGGPDTSRQTHTRVEAQLDGVPEAGLLIGVEEFGDMSELVERTDHVVQEPFGGHEVLASSTSLAREVCNAQEVRGVLEDAPGVTPIYAGNASSLLEAGIPDRDGILSGPLTDAVEAAMGSNVPGDDGTVRTEPRGLLTDPEEFEAHLTAVTTVADAFEAATEAAESA